MAIVIKYIFQEMKLSSLEEDAFNDNWNEALSKIERRMEVDLKVNIVLFILTIKMCLKLINTVVWLFTHIYLIKMGK